jgi:hypothetical protein
LYRPKKRKFISLSVLSQIKLWKNSRCVITVRHCVHCVLGKEGEKQFTYQHFNEKQELKSTFWCLIFFFSLINKLELVSGDCEFGTLKLNYFVWNKVDISVLKFLMLQQLLQFLRDLFLFSITELSAGPIIGFTFDQLNELWIINWR